MHPLCSRHSLLKFTLGHDVTLSETLLELAACRCKYKIQANKDLTQPNDDGHARWRVVVMTHACARENDNTVYISERSQTQSRSTSTRCAHRCSAHMRELVCKLEEDVFRRKEKIWMPFLYIALKNLLPSVETVWNMFLTNPLFYVFHWYWILVI